MAEGNIDLEHKKREHQTQVNMARGIVAHSSGLPEATLHEIESKLRREGLDPGQIEKALIDKANETKFPGTAG